VSVSGLGGDSLPADGSYDYYIKEKVVQNDFPRGSGGLLILAANEMELQPAAGYGQRKKK